MPIWVPAVGILLTLGGMLAGFAAAWGSVRTLVDTLRDEIEKHREARIAESVAIERIRGDVRVLETKLDK